MHPLAREWCARRNPRPSRLLDRHLSRLIGHSTPAPMPPPPPAMSQPPSAKPAPADAGMEKLFSRLPGLIDQARKGTMQQQAIAQVSTRP